MIARLFFCLVPALLCGLIGLLIHWFIGLVFLVAVFGLGVQVTEPRYDRGERR